jgi:hypothetical protein
MKPKYIVADLSIEVRRGKLEKKFIIKERYLLFWYLPFWCRDQLGLLSNLVSTDKKLLDSVCEDLNKGISYDWEEVHKRHLEDMWKLQEGLR